MGKKSEIFEIYNRKMASPGDVINEAFLSLPKQAQEKHYIRSNFSNLIGEIEHTAHEIYKEHQKKCGTMALLEFFGLDKGLIPATPGFIEAIQGSFEELNRFFLSLAQSRKARAGKTFEEIIRRLFKALEYPFDEQIVINGKPDFLLPSEEHYRRHAADCIIFTAKRTLRERWRQIVTEGTRGLGFFLATIDGDITETQLGEMKGNRIYLVVEIRLKENNAKYKQALNVITFENFFRHHLDPAMQRWREAKII
jgi:hypothetical protein